MAYQPPVLVDTQALSNPSCGGVLLGVCDSAPSSGDQDDDGEGNRVPVNAINNMTLEKEDHYYDSNITKIQIPPTYVVYDEKDALLTNGNGLVPVLKTSPLVCTTKQTPDGEKPPLHVQFDDVNEPTKTDSTVTVKGPLETPSLSGDSSSSSSSEESVLLTEARPPDGGWGWVVVAASFIVNLIADGITFSFGVIFVEFLNYFGENREKTAWIGSLFMAMPLLSGPIASFLTDRYGCRRVTILGSVLASTGFVISSMANSMEVLFLTFGVFAGFGLSLCYVASVVIVAYYFDRKRSFATGLSVCGSGIGTFIFAPLIQMLLEEYGWRGTTLILAGLFLNLAVCGALMRDLPWTPSHRAKEERRKNKKNKKKCAGSSVDTFSVSNSTNTASVLQPMLEQNKELTVKEDDKIRLSSSLVNLPTFVRNGERVPLEVIELLSSKKNVYNVLMQNYPGMMTSSRSFSDSGRLNEAHIIPHQKFTPVTSPLAAPPPSEDVTSPGGNRADTTAYLYWLKRNQIISPRHSAHKKMPTTAYLKDLRVHRLSLTYRGAMLNINRYRLRASSCPDIYRNSMTTIAKEKTDHFAAFSEFWELLVNMFDFSHFLDPKFLLFAISNFFLYTWYDIPYVYLTDNAVEMGFSKNDSSMLIGVIGILNMFGEIILGWAGDLPSLNAGVIYAACMILCGLVTSLVPLIKSYWALCTLSGLFGLFIAANYSLTCIILVELLTLERFTNAYGLLLMVQGVANLIGPPIGGWLYDKTGDYHMSFYLAGLFIALSGVFLLILPTANRCRRFKRNQRQHSENSLNNHQQQQSAPIQTRPHPKTSDEPSLRKFLVNCLGGREANNIARENHV